MKRNFVEKERVDGFLIFKTSEYHDVLKKYDEKRLELATLHTKKANLKRRIEYLRRVLEKERLSKPYQPENAAAWIADFFEREYKNRIENFDSEIVSFKKELSRVTEAIPIKRKEVWKLQQKIPSAIKVVDTERGALST